MKNKITDPIYDQDKYYFATCGRFLKMTINPGRMIYWDRGRIKNKAGNVFSALSPCSILGKPLTEVDFNMDSSCKEIMSMCYMSFLLNICASLDQR